MQMMFPYSEDDRIDSVNSVCAIDFRNEKIRCAVFDDNNQPSLSRNAEGELATPTYISFEKNQAILGSAAKKRYIVDWDNTIVIDREWLSSCWKVGYRKERNVTAIDILSRLIKVVVDANIGRVNMCKKVIIPIPCYFTSSDINLIREAAMTAELFVENVVSEDWAIAEYVNKYISDAHFEKMIFIIFSKRNIQINGVRLKDKTAYIFSTERCNVGYGAWEEILSQIFTERLFFRTGIEELNLNALQNITTQVENVRLQLKNQSEISVLVEATGDKAMESISRSELYEHSKILLDEILASIDLMLLKAGEHLDENMGVFIIGDGVEVQQLQEAIKKKSDNVWGLPEEIIVKGALLYAKR